MSPSNESLQEVQLRASFQKHHEKCIKESFPSEELRAQELSRLKATHRKEKQFIRRVLSDAEEVTAASYDISWQLARCKKPFSDGELVKDMFLQSAARLFRHLPNRLTDSNLEAELRCAVTSLDPRIDSLVRSSTNRASSDAFAE